MTSEEATLAVIDALERQGVPYMVVGSLSSNYYGVARATHDADFVLQLGHASIHDVLAGLGPKFRLDAQMSFETVTATSRYVIDLVDPLFKIELFLLSSDAHDQERFRRRRRADIYGHQAYVPSPEDVIITKLRWSRQAKRRKDLEDVENVISLQRENLDLEYTRHWCDTHGTRHLLEDLLKGAPPA